MDAATRHRDKLDVNCFICHRCQNATCCVSVLCSRWGTTQFCALQWAVWGWHNSLPATVWMGQKWWLIILPVIQTITSSFSALWWFDDPGWCFWGKNRSLTALCDSWNKQSRNGVDGYSCGLLRCSGRILSSVCWYWSSVHITQSCLVFFTEQKLIYDYSRGNLAISSQGTFSPQSIVLSENVWIKDLTGGWKLRVISRGQNHRIMLLFSLVPL